MHTRRPKLIYSKVTGFTDVAPLVREQTVKAILTVVPKLSDRVVNGELLRYLAKTANDEQPGIRTNTTICLGKIARNLGANVRSHGQRKKSVLIIYRIEQRYFQQPSQGLCETHSSTLEMLHF
jgi:hypothetical protein